MASLEEIGDALKIAHASGNVEHAQQLATAYNQLKASSSEWENNAPVEGMKSDFEYAREQAKNHGPFAVKKQMAAGLMEGMIPFLNNPKEVDTNSIPYQIAKLGGNVALGTGVAGALGKGAEVLGASPNIVKALTSSGMEAPSSSLAKSMARQSLAGGLTGGATTLLTNPEDTGTGATVGAVLPVGFRGLGALGRFGADLFSGGLSKTNAKAVLEKVMGDKLEASKQALESLPTDTNLTTGQALHGISDPKLAALEEMGRITNGQPFLNKDIAQRQEWVNANKAVSPNLEPAVAHEANVNLAREAELTALQGTKEQDLANKIRQFEQGTAKETPQFGLGETLVERRNLGLKEQQKPFVDNTAVDQLGPTLPGKYTELFNKYPEKISLRPLNATAGDILSDLKTKISPEIADDVISKAKKLTGGIESNVVYGSQPKKGTLEDIHNFLSAIKKARNNTDDRATIANLNKLQKGAEETINNGLSKDALSDYQSLSSEYKTKVAEPYLEGISYDIARKSHINKADIISPEKITDKYLTESGAGQFNKTFGNDPQAIQALRTGIEQKMMNSPNPEKFLQDNRFALDTLGPEIKTNLNALAEKIRTHGAEGKALEAERNAIPKTILTESEQAASPANQARLLKEGIETALPNINEGSLNKLNPEAFLSFMRNNRGNIENQLTDIGQQGSLNQIRSNMIRNQEMQAMAKANREPVEKIIEDESFRQRLPSLIDPAIAFLNMGIRQTEGKISGATGKELSKAMSDPQYALDLFKHLPADQRMALLRNLRASGPTLSRAAIAETNQQ